MFKTYFWKKSRPVLSFIIAIVVFLQEPFCYANDFTLEQLVTGVNLLRDEIQSGELLVTITGYEAPLMTAAEGQQWTAERKAEIQREIDQRTEVDPQYDGDRHYEYHMKQYSEMLQRLVDKIQFHREKSVAFEVYGAPPQFGRRTENFRYRSVMNNRLMLHNSSVRRQLTMSGVTWSNSNWTHSPYSSDTGSPQPRGIAS